LLPIDACARHWWNQRGTDAVTAAIAGGDDYELLFAVPAKGAGRLRAVTRQVAEPVLTRVGVFTKDAHERVLIRDGNEDALPEGFEHFANR
jgi:thiamine-monophosphate kinase